MKLENDLVKLHEVEWS